MSNSSLPNIEGNRESLNVIIYIRVSTKMQAQDDKYSLRAQKYELVRYANQQKWNIVSIIKDVDSGGKFEKKGLEQVMDAAEDRLMDVVLVLDQTRLSRLDGLQWEMLKAVLKKNNVKLAEPGNLVDLNNEIQEFMSDITNWFARRGRREVSRTMMRGKRQMLREGKPWGKVPFEYIYHKEDKSISINEEYAWTIPTIDRLYLDEQLGLVTIAKRLDQIKLNPWGRHWNENLVYRRLISPSYHGDMVKYFKGTKETIALPDIFPKLRTKETYEKIQAEMKRRSTTYRPRFAKSGKIHFLRRTYLICGECGRKIAIESHGLKHGPVYYLKHGRKLRINDRSVCDISINTIRCDHNIVQAIKDILTNETLAKKYIDLEDNQDQITVIKKEIDKLSAKLNATKGKLNRLIDLYVDGVFDKQVLSVKKQNLQNEANIYASNREKLITKMDLLKNKQWNYELIRQYFYIAKNFTERLTPLEQTQMVGSLFPSATVYRDHIVLHGELDEGAPLDIEVKFDLDPYTWHHTKRHKKN